MSNRPKRAKIDPKRVKLGWSFLWAAFGLWVLGLVLNPISAPIALKVPSAIRLDALFLVAALQLAAVLIAALLLVPLARRHKVRLWSILLMVTAVALTSLYHFSWLDRLSG